VDIKGDGWKLSLGIFDGFNDGFDEGKELVVGTFEGLNDGEEEGSSDKVDDGSFDGWLVSVGSTLDEGESDGLSLPGDGIFEGIKDGCIDGWLEGIIDGSDDGLYSCVGELLSLGLLEGLVDVKGDGLKLWLGIFDGFNDGDDEGK